MSVQGKLELDLKSLRRADKARELALREVQFLREQLV
jgi:hypothetical protein